MEGPPFVNHSKFREDFWVALVIGVSGVATTGRIWAESQKIPLVIGGIRTGNLALSNDCLQFYDTKGHRILIVRHAVIRNGSLNICT